MGKVWGQDTRICFLILNKICRATCTFSQSATTNMFRKLKQKLDMRPGEFPFCKATELIKGRDKLTFDTRLESKKVCEKMVQHATNTIENYNNPVLSFVYLPCLQYWIIWYLLQAVASSLVEITPSSCDILLFKEKLDQNKQTNYLKVAAILVHW